MAFSLIIRHAEHKDIEQIEKLCKKFFDVCGYDFCEYDEETINGLLDTSICQGLTSVAEKENKLIGFITGLAFPAILNNKVMCGSELAWWVEPEYRKTSAGIKLLKHIERSAKDFGSLTWSMMCLEELDPDGLESMYKRMGYKPAERTFVRVL